MKYCGRGAPSPQGEGQGKGNSAPVSTQPPFTPPLTGAFDRAPAEPCVHATSPLERGTDARSFQASCINRCFKRPKDRRSANSMLHRFDDFVIAFKFGIEECRVDRWVALRIAELIPHHRAIRELKLRKPQHKIIRSKSHGQTWHHMTAGS